MLAYPKMFFIALYDALKNVSKINILFTLKNVGMSSKIRIMVEMFVASSSIGLNDKCRNLWYKLEISIRTTRKTQTMYI